MGMPVSVIVLTYNEEKNIKACLQSVCGLADEVFVVDSGSTDGTLAIARKFTDRIYEHPFRDFASQRNWAQETLPIKNEWVLHLDADESVDEELAASMRGADLSGSENDGFMMSRKTVFRGRWIRHGGHYPVYHLRLFRKEKGRCEERLYDQHFAVQGKTGIMRGNLVNVIDGDTRLLKAKEERWARLEAQEILAGKGRGGAASPSGDPIAQRKWLKENIYYTMPPFARALAYFLYRYIVRRGFLDGKEGLAFHYWQGFWFRFLVDKHIRCLKKKGAQ